MKKILFVYHVSSIGGGSYCLLNLLKVIDRELFSPMVLLPSKGPLCDEIERLNIPIVYFESLSLYPYNKSLCSFQTIRRIIRVIKCRGGFTNILREVKADIVYFNSMMLFPFLNLAKREGCKTVMHVREHWPLNEHKLQLWLARRSVDCSLDKLIAINKYSASIFPHKDSNIVYDWIDFSNRYEERPFTEIFGEDSSELKVMLFTGGMDKIKGTLEVVKTFSNHVKGNEYRLLLMGGGFDYKLKTKGTMGVVKKWLMKFGWEPYGYKTMKAIHEDKRIKCIPPTYMLVNIIQQAYCTLSFFTIPHANLALAEAIILGTIPIAAETEESIEYSNNGEGAVLFQPKSQQDFAAKIDYVINNYDDIKTRVRKQSVAVKEMFERERNAKLFNSILSELLLEY